MPLPLHLQASIDEALAATQAAPAHHLAPAYRMRLYRAYESPTAPPPVRNPFRGWLGLMAARFVLPIWQQARPLWTDIPAHLPDLNALPEHLIALTEAVLDQTTDVSAVWKEVSDIWYIVGNIGDGFTDEHDDLSLAVYYACDTALKACYEALNAECLGDIQHWEQYTDEDVPDFARDAASSAMVAYAGGGDVQPEDEERRLAFWTWWLGEAIPTAWEQAAD